MSESAPMGTPEVTYYFSTGSRYSYLSMSQMPGIELRCDVKARWVPVNGKRMRALRGVDPFAGPPQSGQYDWDYRERDAKAWARYYGLVFEEPVDVEFDVECLLRGVIAAGRQCDLRGYAWALAQAVFAHRTWPLDQTLVETVALQEGLEMDRFMRDCADPLVQQTLEDNCAEAVARGAFGTPAVFVGEDLYWGNDRLVLLEQALRAQHTSHPFAVQALDHVVLRSQQPEQLVSFYTRLLNVRCEREVDDFLWQLRLGDSLLDILKVSSEARGGDANSNTPSRLAKNMDHFCVRISPYDEAAISTLVTSLGGQVRAAGNIYGARGFGASTYVTDPQGNTIELKAA